MPDQPTAPEAQASTADEQPTAPDAKASTSADEAPHSGVLHARKPMNPTGIAAFVPPTVAVAIACTAYIWLGLGHITSGWVIAPALVTAVVGLIIVAGYMELITGAPPSMEEQFDEHTISEDDVHVHGVTPHDLPLDNPGRAAVLSRTRGGAAAQTPAAATAQAGSDLSRSASAEQGA
jgi:hypothetical protein